MTMTEEIQPWAIVEKEENVFDRPSASVYCDRRQHLFVFNYYTSSLTSSSRSNSGSMTSVSSSNRLPTISDGSSSINGRMDDNRINGQTIIYLERIEYIQRSGGQTSTRSARTYHQYVQSNPYDSKAKELQIFYHPIHPRSDYLYKMISFQLNKTEAEINQWIEALYQVIDEAKKVSELGRRHRWVIREYEKLRRSSSGLTFDSINGWLNSHLGLVGVKNEVEAFIKKQKSFQESPEMTESIFKTIYKYFAERQQEALMRILMSDSIQDNRVSREKFALRIANHDQKMMSDELNEMKKYFKLAGNQQDVTLQQCTSYLWSDANAALDPVMSNNIYQNMDQPLCHYWISSSHNTYLAKTQIFNPASVHCYIQALLKGCRCIEIDVFDNRNGGLEPEITHRSTRIRPLQLREVLEAIKDYAFVASDYPVIISIENHCSPDRRIKMAEMFVEIFGDSLLQSPISPNETFLPSPNQLKRKIILKNSKSTNDSTIVHPASHDSEEQMETPTLDTHLQVQLFDFTTRNWIQYNCSFTDKTLFLGVEYERLGRQGSDDDFSDTDTIGDPTTDELPQIWYHRYISHADAEQLLFSNAGYEAGTFLIRKSVNKNCYCLSFLATDRTVKSIEIKEHRTDEQKVQYALSTKKFDTIQDLVSFYKTYDFTEIGSKSSAAVKHRLSKALPRPTWRQELEKQSWYQPRLTRIQAEQLLLGIGEEMNFLIRESSNRARQDYSISIFTENSIRHCPIYRDDSDLMLMSKTFTSLMEIVAFYSRKGIFQKKTLLKAAISYEEFFNQQRQNELERGNQSNIQYIPLAVEIALKLESLRATDVHENLADCSVEVQLCTYEEDNNTRVEGYLFKFDKKSDWELFSNKLCSRSTNKPLNGHRRRESQPATGSLISLCDPLQATAGLNRLSIYCQGIKLRELNINKAQDLLEKVKSFKEMISVSFAKAITFCSDSTSMILFNQNHLTRIYPDFSARSMYSHNFDPMLYWSTACQLVALNFQMPDRPMHLNAGRFAVNGRCGFVLMPETLRLSQTTSIHSLTSGSLLNIRILAVRHLRTNQTRTISKVIVKTILMSKQRAAENQICQMTLRGPCGILDHRQMSKNHDQSHHQLHSENTDVDLLYFEVTTDNQEFCGQSAIPLAALRAGIRSVQLYDRFNERLDMSALLVDIHFHIDKSFF